MNTKPNGMTYRQAGVDIDAGDALVDRIKPLAARTLRPEVMAGIGGFGALFEIPTGYKEPVLVSGTDGVGTKLKLAFSLDRHDSIGIDLVAMSVNDILVQGAEPLFFLDYFATGRLSVDRAAAVVSGIAKGCQLSGCSLIGGETAEMPGMYSDGEYDLAGFAVGVVEKSQILKTTDVCAGDQVLGLVSSGFHSNGYSLVRAVLEKACGGLTQRHLEPVKLPSSDGTDEVRSLTDLIMAPTRIYVDSVRNVLKTYGARVHTMAHVTGGGIVGNLPRVLPVGLTAELNAHFWPMPPVMRWIQEQGGIALDEMHRVFNCGIGMVVIVDPGYADQIAALFTAHGERVYQLGHIRDRLDKEPQTIIRYSAQ